MVPQFIRLTQYESPHIPVLFQVDKITTIEPQPTREHEEEEDWPRDSDWTSSIVYTVGRHGNITYVNESVDQIATLLSGSKITVLALQ